ncbi:MAG: DNA topology modulation protein [bacterium]
MRSDWKKVMIIGCGGAGKTTLAYDIGKILGLDVTHLDLLFWKPGWIETNKLKWKQIIEEISSKKQWIIDGNYGGTIDIRLSAADTIIFLDMSRFSCLWRVLKRRILFNGRTRPDLTEGCPERLSWRFIKWIWTFPKFKRPRLLEKLDACKNKKNVIFLRSNKKIKSFLKNLQQSFKED